MEKHKSTFCSPISRKARRSSVNKVSVSGDEDRLQRSYLKRDKTANAGLGARRKEALEISGSEKHHRYPVVDASIDNIVGVLPIKELLNCYNPEGPPEEAELTGPKEAEKAE